MGQALWGRDNEISSCESGTLGQLASGRQGGRCVAYEFVIKRDLGQFNKRSFVPQWVTNKLLIDQQRVNVLAQ